MTSRDGAPAGQAAPLVDTVPPPSSTTPKAPTATPTPPPEKESHRWRRSYIIFAFWAIITFLGLPIWWKTMSIYRANLPLSEMNEWAEGKACKPEFPLQITLEAGALQDKEAQTLLRLTQKALDDLNNFPAHHLRLQLGPSTLDDANDGPRITRDDAEALIVRLHQGNADMSSFLDPHRPILNINYPPSAAVSQSPTPSPLATYIATELRSTFAEEQAILSYLLSSSALAPEARTKSLSPETIDSLEKRTTRAMKYSHTYHLTFSLFTAGPAPSTWDIDAAIRDYMKPVLDVLSPVHNFTMDTQVQLYATPGVESEVLTKDDLVSFVNAAEWPLSPSIGGAPTINFIIYIGNQTITLGDDFTEGEKQTSQSWLVPQWGAVYLLPLNAPTSHVAASTLKQPLLTFSSHLLSLLGTPESTSLPLRLSSLSRIRSADLLIRASSTLGSLARLSLALPSISIPTTVLDGVSKSIAHLSAACGDLASPAALSHAWTAEVEAERAFFEKSMVGQLYFPDEHKVAVYLPLLGPIAVPLVVGLLKEIKAWVQRRKEKKASGERKKGE